MYSNVLFYNITIGGISIKYISFDEIKQAYKKLKSYVYYDKTLYKLRRKLAQFEARDDFDKRFIDLEENLKSVDLNDDFISVIKKYKIDKIILPKGINFKNESTDEKTNKKSNGKFITNDFEAEKYETDRIKFLIDADIEIHIISVLWIMKVGYKLEKSFSNNSYGYKLQLTEYEDENKLSKGLKLFKPYFYQYQNWRDNALDIAQALIKRNKDVAILGLDIKSYFDNVRMDFTNLKNEVKKEFKDNTVEVLLTELLEVIHMEYAKIAFGKSYIDENEEFIDDKGLPLPIGLLSSSILANWYLKKLDEAIKQKVNPSYYGRYVDDILIVLSEPIIKNYKTISNNKLLTKIIENYLCENGILECPDNENDDEVVYNISVKDTGINYYDNLKIQNRKVSLYYLKSDSSQAILDNFKENIRKNSSEFRFLPENHKVENEFKFEAHSMLYDDSINKLNSIKAFRHNKYKASVYLSKKIYASRLWNKDSKDAKKTAEQILKFMKGKICLEFNILWEKVFTYFVLKDMKKEFKEFFLYIKDLIRKLEVANEKSNDNSELKTSLLDVLIVAASMPLTLNPKFLDSNIKKSLDSISLSESEDNILTKEIIKITDSLRKSNLMRHSYIFTPLLNYTKLAAENKISLIEKNLHDYNLDELKRNNFEFDKHTMEYSPRFIKFNELNNYFIIKRLFFNENADNKIKNEDILERYLSNSFNEFEKLNNKLGINIENRDKYFEYTINDVRVKATNKNKEKVQKKDENDNNEEAFNNSANKKNDLNIESLSIGTSTKKYKIGNLVLNDEYNKEKLNIGVANIKLSEDDFKKSYRKNYNLSSSRKEKLFKILNLSYTEKVNSEDLDMIIFPEVSVPPAWLPLLSDYSRRHQKAIVCGLEHFISKDDIAYNLIVTILPFMIDNYKYSIVKVRIKNHYSPEEKVQLTGNQLKIPKLNFWHYTKFIWRGVHFSCYNCYELADITHRSIFKSKVDLLIASVYNKDVNYFSNIVESVSRDVHCYFIQVNSSNYGDTRVTQPTKTVVKDIMRFKGGENPTLLATSVDIRKLRDFQFVEYNLQKNNEYLKPTPPDFNKDEVKKRLREFGSN